MVAHRAIRARKEPKFDDLVKPGRNATTKAVIKFEVQTRLLAEKKSAWKVAQSAVFDMFMSHCGPRIKAKLSAEDGWEETKAERDGITLINMIDRLMRPPDEDNAAEDGAAEPDRLGAIVEMVAKTAAEGTFQS